MHQKITYTKLTAKIILTTLMITLIAAFIYGEIMKGKAIHDLSKVDAKKTSMLIFESLYSAMEKGWTKNDLKRVIKRLDAIDPNMKVEVYRSSLVAQLFGDIQEDKTKVYHELGIGLAIVKGFVDILKGNINVKSEANIGTEFSIEVPIILSDN